MGRLSDVDAVTLDGYGTLLTLRDPIGHLARELTIRGVALSRADIERGFAAEARFYGQRGLAGHDEASLVELRTGCAEIFLDEVGIELDPREFAAALDYDYEPLPRVREALRALVARGLVLAVVANWDYGLHEQLRRHGLHRFFAAVVVSAEVGAAKPDPAPFHAALERLGVSPRRALHIGDDRSDEEGAAAAGMYFALAPLTAALAEWT